MTDSAGVVIVTQSVSLRIHQIRDERLTVISTDDPGVQRVEVYELR